MLRARDEIARSDALLIDMTAKPTGRAIEAGIAFAQGKRIVMIMQHGTVIKDTSRGIADALIEYDILEDIVSPLRQLHANWDTRLPDDRHPQH
jgi:nucleoside 2-deoxyribosyltransferase